MNWTTKQGFKCTNIVTTGGYEIGYVKDPDQAELIVRAVNSHADLLAALEGYRTVLAELQESGFSSTAIAAWTRLGQADTRAKHAIAKAKGAL